MKRRLFNVLVGVSLVLCVATAALWVRSYSVVDEVYFTSPHADTERMISTARGTFYFFSSDNYGPYSRPYWVADADPVAPMLLAAYWDTAHGIGGIRFSSFLEGSAGLRTVMFAVKCWLLVFTLAAAPALCALRYLARKRSNENGLCMACGYDLRATPDRCPECGTVAPQ